MNDKQKIKSLENRIHRLNEIGMALSTESDTNKLFEMILEEAKNQIILFLVKLMQFLQVMHCRHSHMKLLQTIII